MINMEETRLVSLLFLYAGPDQILPLVSILGAIIGVLLIWWRRTLLLIRKAWKRLFKRKQTSARKLEPTVEK